MNCFSKFQWIKSHFHIESPDSIKIDQNEIYFKIDRTKFLPLYCKITLHMDPDYVRFYINSDETLVKDNCALIHVPCENVVITKELGYLHIRNSQFMIILQYNPWKVSIYKENLLLCVCRIEMNKFNKDKISFVSEISGKMGLYGLVERASLSRLKQGQKYRLHNTDEFGFAHGSEKPLYGSVPFIMAVSPNHCIGILSRNESDTLVCLTKQRLRRTCRQYWSHDAGFVDMVCMAANDSLKIRQSLLRITGTTPMPPLFALGYHQCRWDNYNQEDIIKIEKSLRQAAIPCDVLWLDIEHTDGKRYFTWDKDKFDPHTLIDYLKEKGRHLVVIIDPHLKEDPDYHIFREAKDADYLVKNEDGTALIGECWPGNSGWVDFISDDASSWWTDKIAAYLREYGSSGAGNSLWVWNDMNEPSVFKCPSNQMKPSALHGNGIEHRAIHNVYGQRMVMASWGGIMKACDDNLRPFLLSRSFFTGSQKYGAIWTGDSLCRWDHLRVSVSMILSLSICGIDFCGADVGGFFGDPEPELLCRWYQLGAMQPFFRAHAHIESKRREPYLIEEPFQEVIKSAVCLRYRLLPYWYLCFWQAETELSPIVSPTWMQFPQYQKMDNDSMYMIGGSILMRPIVSPLCRSISLVLPGSRHDIWYHYSQVSHLWQVCKGSEKVTIVVNIHSIPVFYRGGHCIFIKETSCEHTGDWSLAPYQVMLFPDITGCCSGLLYVDDGRTFSYRTNGQYNLHRCTFDSKDKSVSLETVHEVHAVELSSRSIIKVTIVKSDHIDLSSCTTVVSMDGVKETTATAQMHQFTDRIEVDNIDVEITGEWTLVMK